MSRQITEAYIDLKEWVDPADGYLPQFIELLGKFRRAVLREAVIRANLNVEVRSRSEGIGKANTLEQIKTYAEERWDRE